MIEKEITQGNKLIADFMQIEKESELRKGKTVYLMPYNNQGSFCWDEDKLQYHLSWDWLMFVIEKIESKIGWSVWLQHGETTITNPGFDPGIYWHYPTYKNSREIIEGFYKKCADSKIDASWKVVVDFIKYYNNNKQR